MLAACDLIAFIATRDGSKARAFYEDVLGLRLVGDDAAALVFDANGTMLRISKVGNFTPAPFTVMGWRVPQIRTVLSRLREKGLEFQRYPGLDQDELGIWKSPGGAHVAWFKDPDGNTLSLTQFMP